jgi:hypothetical protein
VVLAVPKRLRYFLHSDAAVQGVVLRRLLRVIERCLREHRPGCSAAARLGAVVFIHRFGSSLNAHLHFHCCILDGVFEPALAADGAVGVVFHAASGLAAAAIAAVQAHLGLYLGHCRGIQSAGLVKHHARRSVRGVGRREG